MTNLTSFVRFAFITLLSIFLLACEGGKESDLIYDSPSDERYAKYGGSILGGDGGVNLLDLGNNKPQDGGAGVGVNSFLWRASLDTIAFMPLTSADPFGGVIITDWYTPVESPGERFKVTVYILDRRLRADGIRVSAFKQNLDATNNWIPVQLTPKTITNLENSILRRARELRIAREGQ